MVLAWEAGGGGAKSGHRRLTLSPSPTGTKTEADVNHSDTAHGRETGRRVTRAQRGAARRPPGGTPKAGVRPERTRTSSGVASGVTLAPMSKKHLNRLSHRTLDPHGPQERTAPDQLCSCPSL